MTTDEIVRALRCVSAPGGPTGDCTKCLYWKKEQLNDKLKEKFGTDEWTSCDCDKVGIDAANLIERLRAENADLYKEIEWKDMVIALAQRKQAEAEAERDALREKQRWIPVSEKLPEYDMPQLALTAGDEVLIANYAYGEWFDTWGQDVDVAHWMPLPEAAEEGEKP